MQERVPRGGDVERLARERPGEDIGGHVRLERPQHPVGGRLGQEGQDAEGAAARAGVAQGGPALEGPESEEKGFLFGLLYRLSIRLGLNSRRVTKESN